MASGCASGGLHWILGKMSSLKMWSGTGPGCPGSGESPSLKHSNPVWMWHLGPWFKGGHGSTGLMAGFNHLRGLSNLNNSVILVFHLPLGTTCQGWSVPEKSQEGIKITLFNWHQLQKQKHPLHSYTLS